MENNGLNEVLPLRMDEDLKHLVRVEAAHRGVSMSEFFRVSAREVAERQRTAREERATAGAA